MLAKQLAMNRAFKYLFSTSTGQIQNKQNTIFANTLHYTDWLTDPLKLYYGTMMADS